MAEPNRLAAALSYEQDRPAFGNPSMLEQGRKMRERKQAEQVDRSAQNVKSDLLARALMYRYNPETLTGLTDTPGPQTLDEAAGLDPRVDRSTFLPYSKKEGLHVPAVVADLMKLATASNPQYSNLMQPEEAMPLATNMMGGGIVASRLAPAPAGSLGMNVTSKRAFTAPQDEALRLAQQRAALPVEQHGLGLPADNTPTQRADAMFPESGYHGSKISNIKELKTGSKILQEKNPNNDVEKWAHDNREAIFISPSSKFANDFTGNDWVTSDPAGQFSPTMYPLRFKAKNVWDYDNPQHLEQLKNKYNELYPMKSNEKYIPSEQYVMQKDFNDRIDSMPTRDTNYFIVENEKAQNAIKNLNNDAFYNREQGVKNIGIYNPDNIRSRFAAFDPFRRNAALAAALGVAAPDLLAEEKK